MSSSSSSRTVLLLHFIRLVNIIPSVSGFSTWLKYLDSVPGFSTWCLVHGFSTWCLVPGFSSWGSVPGFSTLLQYLASVPGFSTWLQYLATVPGFSTWLQHMVFSTLLQYLEWVVPLASCLPPLPGSLCSRLCSCSSQREATHEDFLYAAHCTVHTLQCTL